MSLLIPDTGLLFWMVLSFSIVLFILAKYGFPTILKAVEKRRNYIDDSLEAARQNEEKAASLSLQAKSVMDEAHAERAVVIKEAQKISAEIIAQAKQRAEESSNQRLTKAMAEAEDLKRKAMKEVSGEIASISIKIAEKVIGENLHMDEKQQQLIDRLLEENVNRTS